MKNIMARGRKALLFVCLLCVISVGLVTFPSTSHVAHAAPAASYPGGLWVSPGNGFTFEPGVWYNLQAKGYPTNSGDPPISYVNFTGYWGGSWHLICQVYNHDSNN